MTAITFMCSDGTATTVQAAPGDCVMRTALANAVDGIVAECGGAMACATCHVYVDDAFLEATGRATGGEAEMLEFTASPLRQTSRLSCQITITPRLGGLVVHLPDSQM